MERDPTSIKYVAKSQGISDVHRNAASKGMNYVLKGRNGILCYAVSETSFGLCAPDMREFRSSPVIVAWLM